MVRGIIIALVVTICLGIFKVVNSLVVNKDLDETVSNQRNTTLEKIQNIDDENAKNIVIKYYIGADYITENEVNIIEYSESHNIQ